MMGELFRPLKASEVEVRVNQITDKGYALLLYKDARCDNRILDEFGAMDWRDEYEVINGVLYCTVSLWDDKKQQWISKQNCGTKSNTEKEKGEASDAFKRACFNWGIGRELYSAPFIWVNSEPVKNKKGKLEPKEKDIHVSEMEVDKESERIVFLEISDRYNKKLFSYDIRSGKEKAQKEKIIADKEKADASNEKFEKDTDKIISATEEQINNIKKGFELLGLSEEEGIEKYKFKKFELLTSELAERLYKKINSELDGKSK